MPNEAQTHRDAGLKCLMLACLMLGGIGGLLWAHWHQTRYREAARRAFEIDAVRIASVWTYRAPVCDRYGTPLNVTVDEYALAIQPSAVRDIRSTRRQTLDLVEEEMARLAIDLWPRQAQVKRVPREDIEAHLMRASPMPLILWRDLDSETLQRWLLARTRYPAVNLVRLPKRVYHLPDLAPLTRGRAYMTRRGGGEVNQDCDFPDLTMAGWFGAERWRDAELCGQPGVERLYLDAVLFRQSTLRQADPVTGQAVTLTLDMNLQQWAQEALAGMSGGLVVMRSDGDILALADATEGEPILALDAEHRTWQEALRRQRVSDANRCLADPTAPGSTVKPLVALAALQAGCITPETRFECTGRVLYGRNTAVHCHKLAGHGSLNLYQALAVSCNAYFLQVAEKVGWQRIHDMMLAAGLGQLPGEGLTPSGVAASPLDARCAPGVVDSPDWKRVHYQSSDEQVWRPVDTGFLAIGQADTRITPLQAAVMANAVAMGQRVRPRLFTDEPRQALDLPVDAVWREAVMQGLREVVHHPQGSGRTARVGGITLAAKTGSAQVGTADSPRTDVWMVMMYPGYANEVRLVIAAMAHDQTSGGRDLGHRLGRLVERIQEWESWTENRRRQWPDGGNGGTVAQVAR
jgi:cell division protein FtsI/penicillin-binding protein 2